MSWFWKETVVTLESYGMGLEHIETQHHRFLPIQRWRPRTVGPGGWRWEWKDKSYAP